MKNCLFRDAEKFSKRVYLHIVVILFLYFVLESVKEAKRAGATCMEGAWPPGRRRAPTPLLGRGCELCRGLVLTFPATGELQAREIAAARGRRSSP